MILQSDAALMYDAMSVLTEAFGKMLRKNPDLLNRSTSSAAAGPNVSSNNGYLNSRPSNGSKQVQHYCGTGPDFRDPVVPFEVGEKIAKHIRKVRNHELLYP